MLDINFIRQNLEKIKQNCRARGVNLDINQLFYLDNERKKLIGEVENLRAKRNKLSHIGPTEEKTVERSRALKKEIKEKESALKKTEEELTGLLRKIPNLPFDDVPLGGEEANVVVKTKGKIPKFNFKPLSHLEIGKKLDLIDTERAAKVSGSRFGYLKKEAALLEFALICFVFEFLTKKGFLPVIPPVLVKPEIMEAMGYIDTKEDLAERYFLEKDKLFLVGTAEQSVVPMHRNEIFEDGSLPKRYIAFSSCFREEAGSYGKDTTGILRVHQFDKIEMISYAKPSQSKEEQQFLIAQEEGIFRALGIPYRLVHLSSGDMCRVSASTFDIEAWIPSQNRYREVTSCSNCTDFQARRLNIRYRNRKTGKTEFVHILNATGLALGRAIIAIIENFQEKDCRIKIPKVLRRYLPGKPKTIPFL